MQQYATQIKNLTVPYVHARTATHIAWNPKTKNMNQHLTLCIYVNNVIHIFVCPCLKENYSLKTFYIQTKKSYMQECSTKIKLQIIMCSRKYLNVSQLLSKFQCKWYCSGHDVVHFDQPQFTQPRNRFDSKQRDECYFLHSLQTDYWDPRIGCRRLFHRAKAARA